MTLNARHLLPALCMAAALASAPVNAQAQTFAQTLVQAYNYDPSISVARAGLRGADENVPQARAGLRPRVSASATAGLQNTEGLTDGFQDSESVSLDGAITLFDGGDTAAAIEAARAGVTQSRATLSGIEQDVLLSAATAFLDVVRDEQFVALAVNNVRVVQNQLEAAQDRFEVGEITRTEVAQARSRLAAAQSNLVASRGALTRSRDAYIAAVGIPATDLAAPPPVPSLPATLAEAEQLAVTNAPSLRALRAAIEAAEFDIDRARAAFRPNIEASGSVSSSRSVNDVNTDDARVQLQATLPLYQGGSLSSRVRQATAAREQAEAELQDGGRQVRLSTAAAWANLGVARASIAATREGITAARIAFQGVTEEARLGARTTLDVLDAEQELRDAQSNLVSAQRDELVQAYTLLRAVGLMTPSHLGLDVETYDPDVNYNAVENGPFATGGRGEILDRILGRF